MKILIKKYVCGILSLFCIYGLMLITVKNGTFYSNIDEYAADTAADWAQYGYTTVADPSMIPGNESSTPQTQKNTQPTSEKKVVKSCDHTYETTVVREATCKDEGELKFVCSQCGDSYTQKTAATGEHNYESIVTTEVTCTEAGVMTYTCTGCGESYTEEIPTTGHKYETKVTKAATCVVPGEQLCKCSLCGDEYTDEIPALGHVPSEAKVTKEAGLFTPGEKVSVCATCGETLSTEEIPSQYPITYLYIIIGAVIAIAVVTTVVIVLKKKRRI